MGFFKAIRLRHFNKVFYQLKCPYPCGFPMWHFKHYPGAERESFDLTSPTRNKKQWLLSIRLFHWSIAHNSLQPWKCFNTQSFFSGILLSPLAPALQDVQKTLGYQVLMNADQLLNQNRLSTIKKWAELTRNEKWLLQCKQFTFIRQELNPYLVETQFFLWLMTKPEVPPTWSPKRYPLRVELFRIGNNGEYPLPPPPPPPPGPLSFSTLDMSSHQIKVGQSDLFGCYTDQSLKPFWKPFGAEDS